MGRHKRRKPGRPRLYVEPVEPMSVTVSRSQRKWLLQKQAGASATVRKLIEEAMDRRNCKPRPRRAKRTPLYWKREAEELADQIPPELLMGRG